MKSIDEIQRELQERREQSEASRRYGNRLLAIDLEFWQECKDFEQKYRWTESSGHETVRHYFANLSQSDRDRAVKFMWDEKPVTPSQLRVLKWQFGERGYFFVREDFTMLEASMLFAWLEDFDNLDRKPLCVADYVLRKRSTYQNK